jgi:SpoVK/Ycf46/Vps4 family AAA+-type ATPase
VAVHQRPQQGFQRHAMQRVIGVGLHGRKGNFETQMATSACRRTLAQLEIEPGSLIPWNRMETSGLEAVAAFARAQRNTAGTESHG